MNTAKIHFSIFCAPLPQQGFETQIKIVAQFMMAPSGLWKLKGYQRAASYIKKNLYLKANGKYSLRWICYLVRRWQYQVYT